MRFIPKLSFTSRKIKPYLSERSVAPEEGLFNKLISLIGWLAGCLVFIFFLTGCDKKMSQSKLEARSLQENPGSGSARSGIFAESFLSILPGKTGFGMDTPAGSGPERAGGTVVHVTSLADSGSGTLREALATDGARIVVFDVSGYIELKTVLKVEHPYLTIAGQTAPSPGITLKGAGIEINSHDVLIQHIRVRVGDAEEGPSPSVRGGIGVYDFPDEEDVYNVVIDHVSVSWAVDQNFDTWYEGVHDVTISNSISSEALWHSIHPKGPHSKGMLVGYGTHNLSVIGNLFAHNDQRNPNVHGNTSILFVNNLIYNWYGSHPVRAAGGFGSDYGPFDATLVGNVYLRGKDTVKGGRKSIPIEVDEDTADESRMYIRDNWVDQRAFDSWDIVKMLADDDVRVDTPPVWIPALQIKRSAHVPRLIFESVGARPADRDAVDRRILTDVKRISGRIIDSPKQVGGWPPLAHNVRGKGGVPKLNIPSQKIQPSGYTQLEEWLHSLSHKVERPPMLPER